MLGTARWFRHLWLDMASGWVKGRGPLHMVQGWNSVRLNCDPKHVFLLESFKCLTHTPAIPRKWSSYQSALFRETSRGPLKMRYSRVQQIINGHMSQIRSIRGIHGFRVHPQGKMLKDVKWAWSLDATKSWAAVSWRRNTVTFQHRGTNGEGLPKLKKHTKHRLSNRTHKVGRFQTLSCHYSVVLKLLKRQGMTTCPLHSDALLLSCCSYTRCARITWYSFPVLVTTNMSKNCAKCMVYTKSARCSMHYVWFLWLIRLTAQGVLHWKYEDG